MLKFNEKTMKKAVVAEEFEVEDGNFCIARCGISDSVTATPKMEVWVFNEHKCDSYGGVEMYLCWLPEFGFATAISSKLIGFIPTETPEEREALDMIDTTSRQVESLANNSELPNGSEWNNGDECVYMTHNVVHQFIGPCPKREGYGYIQAPGYEVNFVELSKLSKPESQEQKAERERLGAAYDLYLAGNKHCSFNSAKSFDEFKSDDFQLNFWLAIVDKTGYRKGVKLCSQ